MEQSFEKTIHSHSMNLDLKDAGPEKISLNTLCTDLFLIIFNITPHVDMGSEKEMRRIIRFFVDRFESNCKSAGIKSKKIELVKYALVAIIDRKALALPSQLSGPWSLNQLQCEYFKTTDAGERFFEFLDKMMLEPEKYVDVMEVYYLCLCLGFKGKYNDNKGLIEDLIKNVAHTINKYKPHKTPVEVSSSPVCRESPKRRAVPLVSTWKIIAASSAVALLIWCSALMAVSKQSLHLLPL